MIDLIAKKRDGEALSTQEIAYIVAGYTAGEIPDYQMASFLMAVYFRGMIEGETADLTLAMARSGEMVDLSSIEGIKVDKHSTGGVADTTTLVVLPLVAAAGVTVAKMSGRGLGFTGGTIDKLEAIPGFETTLSKAGFIEQLKEHRMAITGQSDAIAPADGKIYALRDVTGTVESLPLIASSIMSKKIASGADKILLDVKVGSGAFMRDLDSAIRLAETMVGIGRLAGRETRAIISSMEEPLGYAIGNSMEVQEAIEILSGGGSGALKTVCLTLGAHMLDLAGAADGVSAGYETLERLLCDGAGLRKLRELTAAQGGDVRWIDRPELFPQAKYRASAECGSAGYVQSMDTAKIGYAAAILGAGRMFKGQEINLSVGVMMRCRIGDFVRQGDVLAVLEADDREKLDEALGEILRAIHIGAEKIARPPVILGIVDAAGFKSREVSK